MLYYISIELFMIYSLYFVSCNLFVGGIKKKWYCIYKSNDILRKIYNSYKIL